MFNSFLCLVLFHTSCGTPSLTAHEPCPCPGDRAEGTQIPVNQYSLYGTPYQIQNQIGVGVGVWGEAYTIVSCALAWQEGAQDFSLLCCRDLFPFGACRGAPVTVVVDTAMGGWLCPQHQAVQGGSAETAVPCPAVWILRLT